MCFSVFLRAVYSLGESSNSSTVMFRTSLHDCVLDDCGNEDSADKSTKLGCVGSYVTAQSSPEHYVNCPVSEKGDDGSKSLPARHVSQESDVWPVGTYPFSARKSTEQVELKGHSDQFQPHGSDDTLADDVETESRDEEEPKFLPKPPDESAVPRRNSISRRGPLRRRADSVPSQHSESKVGGKAGTTVTYLVGLRDSSVTQTDSLSIEDASSLSRSEPATRQGTKSSSKSRPEDLAGCRSREPTRRSSSLGAVMRKPQDTKERTKPPAGKQASCTDHDSAAHTEDNELRKQGAKTDVKVTLKNSSPLSRIPQPRQDNTNVRQTKRMSPHKRYVFISGSSKKLFGFLKYLHNFCLELSLCNQLCSIVYNK